MIMRMLNGLFVNSRHDVRSGWKIASVIMIYIMFSLILGVVARFLPLGKEGVATVTPYIGEISFILAVLVALKLIDDKSPHDMGFIHFRWGIRDFITGLVTGAALMTAIFAILLGFGRVELANGFSNPVWSHYLWSGLILYILVGFAEEMFFRGYCITALQQTGRTWFAVICSSLLFSFAHLGNPNASVVALANIFIVGLLFAFMYIKTGNLWMPIGFHISWNYFQGNIFGFPVSGTAPHGIYNIDSVRGALWSGGSFGPEGGLLATLLLGVGFLVVWLYPVKSEMQKRGVV
ncbi:MAG TPA: type II CAAX endopeptidase family protein [Bacillales bacterium]|nr:type II CAAX endopeptidase family protein [Bacillales bacterium]